MRGERFTCVEPRGPRWVAWLARGLLVTVGGVICWFLLSGVAGAKSAAHDEPVTPEQASRIADRVVDTAPRPSGAVPKPHAPATGVDAVDRAAEDVTQQADDATQQLDETVDAVRDVEQPDSAVNRGNIARADNTQPSRHHAGSSRTPDRPPHTTSTPDAPDVANIAWHRTPSAGAQPAEVPVPDETTVTTTALAMPTATTSDGTLFTLPSSAAAPMWQAEFARSGSGEPPVSPD